jgi:Tetrahydrofolate dehydrogenase/cyclohydrolase, NAD(P)-binding domain
MRTAHNRGCEPRQRCRRVSLVTDNKISSNLYIPRFHAYNIGHLSSRASDPIFAPCTPSAVIRLLKSTSVPISGSNAVVLGRSDIVGSPVASMLRKADATVTQCHSKSKNIPDIVLPLNYRKTTAADVFVLRSKLLISLCLQSERQSLSKAHGSNLELLSLTSVSIMLLASQMIVSQGHLPHIYL